MALSELRLRIVAPGNAEFTCLQGRGTLTSYLLVADEVASLVDVCEAVPVPWGTHLGIRFHMNGPRTSPWYRALTTPRTFDAFDASADPEEWKEAVDDASVALAKCGGIAGSFL